jgi:ribosome assembly protein 3
MARKEEATARKSDPAFEAYYLERSTQELSEDLDKVRNTNDFRADSIQFLVHALQQGASQFSPQDQSRVMSAVESRKKA